MSKSETGNRKQGRENREKQQTDGPGRGKRRRGGRYVYPAFCPEPVERKSGFGKYDDFVYALLRNVLFSDEKERFADIAGGPLSALAWAPVFLPGIRETVENWMVLAMEKQALEIGSLPFCDILVAAAVLAVGNLLWRRKEGPAERMLRWFERQFWLDIKFLFNYA